MDDWLQDLALRLGSFEAPLLFAINFIASTFPLPGWPISVGAGLVLGFLRGFALIFVSNLAGACCAFLLARHVLRRHIKKIIDRHRKLKAVDVAMVEEGWKAVALLQLTPLVPLGLQNYFLGMSRVKLGSFAIGTAIGSIPSGAFYVAIGSTGRYLFSDDGDPWKWALFVLGVVAAIALTTLIGRVAARRLGRHRSHSHRPHSRSRSRARA
jgi:uncharacterized membrane protein YdjX (TVP38/TMEM64 family)